VTAPLVTVIVPNYNHAKSLPLCLAAISRQTYHPLEVIVVDDRSTDDSVPIAKSLGANVISTPENGGPAMARNLGAACANGQILFFVDADGALAPDAVATAVAMLAAEPGLGAVCGIEDADPLVLDSQVEDYRTLQHHYWSIASQGEVSFLFSAMFAIRAEVFAEIGPFNPRLRNTEEVDYGHRLSARYPVRSTAAVHGKLDHDEELGPLLHKLFHRVRCRVPMYARKRRFAKGYETPSRAGSSVAAGLAVLTAPLAAVLGPWWLAVSCVSLGVSLACDARMYRYVLARRSAGFTAFFVGVHLLVNVVIAGAMAAGVVQWLCSRRFRALYDEEPSVAGAGR
jgi:glycosyltransferase involved in cell wall biosynthesis